VNKMKKPEIVEEREVVNDYTDIVTYKCSICGKVLCVETQGSLSSMVHHADSCPHFELSVYGNTSWDQEDPEVKDQYEMVKYAGTLVYAWKRR